MYIRGCLLQLLAKASTLVCHGTQRFKWRIAVLGNKASARGAPAHSGRAFSLCVVPDFATAHKANASVNTLLHDHWKQVKQ